MAESRLNLDLDSIQSEQPELGAVWTAINDWLKRRPSSRYLDPRDLATDLRRIPVPKLNRAMDVLLDRGYLVQVYRLVDPATHTLLPNDYKSISEVPTTVLDRRDQLISTDTLEVIPLLKATRD